jgi:glycine cleavage system H protein
MTAGILSYQLCERQFDCEHCPLDQALRTHFRRGAPAAELRAPQARPAPGRDPLRRDRLYSRRHCWVKRFDFAVGADMLVRVGLEPGLASALLAPRAVVRAEPGEPVRQGEVHLWIVTEGGTFGIATPVGGTLHHTNALLNDRPHLLASRPMDEGWLFELRVNDASTEFGALLDATSAERTYEADTERFQAGIRGALEARSATTPVMQDGGVMLQSVSDMLGPVEYFSLLRRIYG